MRRKVIIKKIKTQKILWYEDLNKMLEKEYLKDILPEYEHITISENCKSGEVFVINDDGLQNKKFKK